MRIAVDGMGGDNAPEEIVKGCVEAVRVTRDEIYIVSLRVNCYDYKPNEPKTIDKSSVDIY